MDLKAVMLACTLKKSPAVSNAEALVREVDDLMTSLGVTSEILRVVDDDIPCGVESGLGAGGPVTGQCPFYGKVAGVIVTGNEEGAHDVATTLFNLTHLGAEVPGFS